MTMWLRTTPAAKPRRTELNAEPNSPGRKAGASTERTTTMPTKTNATLTATERQQLADAFDAILGVASEHGAEFFDSYHKRGGDGLFGELEKILVKLAPDEMKKVLE